jgi:outer membrane protein OmpA-like peptidoglycan-associated protein
MMRKWPLSLLAAALVSAAGCGGTLSRPVSLALTPEPAPAPASADAPDPAAGAEEGGGLGQREVVPLALKGRLYFLETNTHALPDFSALTPVGIVYAATLNVTPRSFETGFPGVADRSEWFAIDYHGTFHAPARRKYEFRLTSDDGARLFVDDNLVIDNDGVHGARAAGGSAELAQGLHTVRVSYFQGPRSQIALVLEMAESGGPLQVFDTRVAQPVTVSRAPGKLGVTIGEEMLFDPDRSELRPNGGAVIGRVRSDLVDPRPTARVIIEAHTDDALDDAHALSFSRRRAEALAAWLVDHGIAPRRIDAVGYGSRYPKVPNASPENRAKNRRVEIVIVDPTSLP